MGNSKTKKSSEKKELRFAYRVRFHQWDEVLIEKLQLLKVTKQSVTYITESNVEFTDVKNGPSHKWFPLRTKAIAFGKSVVKSRIEFYKNLISKMQTQSKRLKRSVPM